MNEVVKERALSSDLTARFMRAVDGALLPMRSTEGAVGYDLFAYAISETGRSNKIVVPPRDTRLIRCGVCIELPPGLWAGVYSRSGLAKKSLFVANAPGVIDPDYRGEIGVLLYNGGYESYYVQHEDRIAQLVFHEVVHPIIVEAQALSPTERGASGYGSTGR